MLELWGRALDTIKSDVSARGPKREEEGEEKVLRCCQGSSAFFWARL